MNLLIYDNKLIIANSNVPLTCVECKSRFYQLHQKLMWCLMIDIIVETNDTAIRINLDLSPIFFCSCIAIIWCRIVVRMFVFYIFLLLRKLCNDSIFQFDKEGIISNSITVRMQCFVSIDKNILCTYK